MTQPESLSVPRPEISPVSTTLPPGQAPVLELTEVVAALTETHGLVNVTLSMVGEAESLHENQLAVRYEVVTNITMIGRVY